MWEIEAWKSVLTEPDRVFAEQKAKASTKTALVWVSLIGALSYATIGLINTDITMAVGLAVFGLIFSPILFLLSSGTVFLFAKLLGGNGAFREQAYLTAVAAVPVGFFSILLTLFTRVPLVNIVVLLVMFAMLGYSGYLQVKIFKFVHGLSASRALLALFLPAIILFVILVIIIIVFAATAYSSFGSALGGAMPTIPAP